MVDVARLISRGQPKLSKHQLILLRQIGGTGRHNTMDINRRIRRQRSEKQVPSISRSALCRSLRRLERRGLVRRMRSPAFFLHRGVELTEAGRACINARKA